MGRKFIVVTDHAALKWLFSPTRRDPHHRHDRLILDLQQFDFTVTHRAGTAHANADSLSRVAELLEPSPTTLTIGLMLRSQTGSLPVRQPRVDSEWINRHVDRDLANAIKASFEESELSRISSNVLSQDESKQSDLSVTHDSPTFPSVEPPPTTGSDSITQTSRSQTSSPDFDLVSTIDLALSQREDDDLYSVILFVKKSVLPTDPRKAAMVQREAKYCRCGVDGILINIAQPPGTSDLGSHTSRPVIPTSLRSLLLAQYHDDSISGHLGEDKTFDRLVRRYYWPGMRQDIVSYVRTCDPCQRRKTPSHLGSDTIGVPVRQSAPFQRISINVLGPLPLTARNNRYCLCVVDLYTRYPMVFPLSNQRSSAVATILLERVFLEHGFPSEVLSDRGTNFVSKLMDEVMALCQVRHITTLSYSPQTNGVVERNNHSLLTMLSHYLQQDQRDWDRWLPYVLFAFRSAPHTTLGHSPFFLLYGREPRFPIDHALSVGGSRTSFTTPNEEAYLADVAARFAMAREAISRRLDAVDQARTIANSQLARLRQFNIGDKVLRWQPQLRDPAGKTRKLAKQWEGPFLIVDKNENHNTYELAKLNSKGQPTRGAKTSICQAARLKRYYERPDRSALSAQVSVIRALSLFAADACDSSLLDF